MSLLQSIHSGKRSKPPRLLVYGSEGIGKSTLRAEEKITEFAAEIDTDPNETGDFYPPLSQPIPEKDSQFVQTVKLQNIPLNDPERLITCLFDLFDVRYREQLVLDLVAKMETDDGKKTVNRILSKLNKKHSN